MLHSAGTAQEVPILLRPVRKLRQDMSASGSSKRNPPRVRTVASKTNGINHRSHGRAPRTTHGRHELHSETDDLAPTVLVAYVSQYRRGRQRGPETRAPRFTQRATPRLPRQQASRPADQQTDRPTESSMDRIVEATRADARDKEIKHWVRGRYLDRKSAKRASHHAGRRLAHCLCGHGDGMVALWRKQQSGTGYLQPG